MTKLNITGLNPDERTEISDQLNDLLANYQIFYMNTRGFHWNIQGEKFFELHGKFEEIYTDLLLKLDELAERIITLGSVPLHSFSEYIEKSDIREQTNLSDAQSCVESVLESYQIIIQKQRTILETSEKINDDGTNAMISDFTAQQEKTLWMYAAFLGK